MMGRIQSIPGNERIQHIDIIRGLAIFGILLVNMAHFSYPDLYLAMLGPENFFTKGWGSADNLIVTFLDSFVQVKFITMFSFLFGFGMIVMLERTEEKGRKFGPIFIRRLLALLLFGTVHAFFIWDGDILMDYALLGFVLILFRNRKPNTILTWAFVLYSLFAVPLVLSSLTMDAGQGGEMQEWMAEQQEFNEQEAKQALEIYSDGTVWEIFKQRIHDRVYYMSVNGKLSLNPFLYFLANIPYFCMFLLGVYFAKKKIFHRPADHRLLLMWLWLICLFIGVPSNIMFGLTGVEAYVFIGAPFLMMFYMITCIYLIRYSWGEKLLMPFAAVGRTAFTNYVMQSVIATMIFYNYGLGLYGSVPPFMGLLITLAIFSLQLVISNWWVRRYQYGPLEWVWRMITYMAVPGFKKKEKQAL